MSSTKMPPWPAPGSAAPATPSTLACSTSPTASRTVMKYRCISGCVTVSGPPRSNCRRNSGTTDPVLPSTLPNRTVTQRIAAPPARTAATSSAWQYISANRLLAPITLLGFTALSVEISTIARAPAARAASATCRVPTVLVSRSSPGFASPIGTCFSAAAWNTRSGRNSEKTARMRPWSRTSAMQVWRGVPGCVSCSSWSMLHRAYSPLSSNIRWLGPRPAHCRASSDPMVPPAPVTSTRRPRTSAAMPSRSSGTCGRFSKSSMATGASSISPFWVDCSAVGRGTRRTGTPCVSACASTSASTGPAKSGCVTTSAAGSRPSARSRASTAAVWPTSPRMAWPWMRRPDCPCRNDSSPSTR